MMGSAFIHYGGGAPVYVGAGYQVTALPAAVASVDLSPGQAVAVVHHGQAEIVAALQVSVDTTESEVLREC